MARKFKRSLSDEMDKECVALCEAINLMPGLSTVESCCGHGQDPFCIWFKTKGLRYLPKLLYWFGYREFNRWVVVVNTDCLCSPVTFLIVGPVGAYKEAKKIAELIKNSHPRREKMP
jgi:hypothetical protein